MNSSKNFCRNQGTTCVGSYWDQFNNSSSPRSSSYGSYGSTSGSYGSYSSFSQNSQSYGSSYHNPSICSNTNSGLRVWNCGST